MRLSGKNGAVASELLKILRKRRRWVRSDKLQQRIGRLVGSKVRGQTIRAAVVTLRRGGVCIVESRNGYKLTSSIGLLDETISDFKSRIKGLETTLTSLHNIRRILVKEKKVRNTKRRRK